MFRSPVSICVSMNPLAKATDESPVARGLSTRALFIRDAISAPVWNANLLWDCSEIFRSPVSKCVSMNPLAKATDESPVARGLSTRALFIRDAIFATVWNANLLWDCSEIFRSPVSKCVSMNLLA